MLSVLVRTANKSKAFHESERLFLFYTYITERLFLLNLQYPYLRIDMRYKEFNNNTVLEKCIPLFWKNGFRGCSIQDLVEATRVNRFSLYKEFENKEGVLYSSLLLYRERYSSKNLEILKQDGDVTEILRQFYLSFLEDKNKQAGCYFIHVATELADDDEKVQELLKEYLAEIQTLFADLLERNGESNATAVFSARQLIGLFCTSMSFCLIHAEEERNRHINNGINVILKNYATSVK